LFDFIYVFYYICDIFEEEPVKVSNGSKTAVMDLIGFLCFSLGSSTVQLHDSLGSRRACVYSKARFSSPNDDRGKRSVLPKSSIVMCFFMGKRTQCTGFS
jgi:hypothetical protein